MAKQDEKIVIPPPPKPAIKPADLVKEVQQKVADKVQQSAPVTGKK